MNEVKPPFEHCSFCGLSVKAVPIVISGEEACICPNCLIAAHRTLAESSGYRYQFHSDQNKSIQDSLKSGFLICIIALAAIIAIALIYR